MHGLLVIICMNKRGFSAILPTLEKWKNHSAWKKHYTGPNPGSPTVHKGARVTHHGTWAGSVEKLGCSWGGSRGPAGSGGHW